MPWVILFISAGLEAVWATALGASDSFTNVVPSVVFFVGLALSMATLAFATRHIPISVAYAIWSGSGAALTVIWAMATGTETAGVLKVLFLTGIVACIVGLKLLKPHKAEVA
ncbi:DMT family transporter [Streptomyces endophyticus]|uniref:Multidrug efflux SMR transporter n=1 Tax=Streptomyces endophyticus TaxID=714166 RepID=A0ABU6FAN2_9ACTN|nr:multidrug efflux SMR transporter [Streptomyces endophyticus]MEB8340667.1 multidrug efflux SMR transporter [Streptomyces endophyticus]